jgi:prepilin-type processing-associated H-X9-DG protein
MAEYASKYPGQTPKNKFSYFLSLNVNRYVFEPDGHVHTEAKSEAEMPNPVRTVLAGDAGGKLVTVVHAPLLGAGQIPERHSAGSNYVFIDGHAECLSAQAAFSQMELEEAANKH